MFASIFGLIVFTRVLRNALQDPAFRALTTSVVVVLVAGTFTFRVIEDWSVVDSLYFCVITLTTIGFGDFSPETTAGKIFTIFYVFIGLGFVMAFVTTLVQRSKYWAEADDAHAENAPDIDQGGTPGPQ